MYCSTATSIKMQLFFQRLTNLTSYHDKNNFELAFMTVILESQLTKPLVYTNEYVDLHIIQ